MAIDAGRTAEDTIEGDVLEATRAISIIAAQAKCIGVHAPDWLAGDRGLDEAVAAAVPMRARHFGPCEGPDALINALAYRMPDLRSVGGGIHSALRRLDTNPGFDYRDRVRELRLDAFCDLNPALLPNLQHLSFARNEAMTLRVPASVETLTLAVPQLPGLVLEAIRLRTPSSRLRQLCGYLTRGTSLSEARADLEATKGDDPFYDRDELAILSCALPDDVHAQFDEHLEALRAECVRRGISFDCVVVP